MAIFEHMQRPFLEVWQPIVAVVGSLQSGRSPSCKMSRVNHLGLSHPLLFAIVDKCPVISPRGFSLSMPLFPDLKNRYLVPEKMDDPNLPESDHELALKGLRRINRFSGTVSHLAHRILQVASRRAQDHWEILDIGCASGENLIDLYARLSRQISVRVTGWDISPFSIGKARELAAQRGFSEELVRFEVVDALKLSNAKPIADIVMNSLFMHHFDEPTVVELLRQSSGLASVAVLADDLHRTRFGWFLARLGCHLLSRSPVVHFDGPQSVRAAFTLEEIQRLAERAGLVDCKFVKHWPERYTLEWEK